MVLLTTKNDTVVSVCVDYATASTQLLHAAMTAAEHFGIPSVLLSTNKLETMAPPTAPSYSFAKLVESSLVCFEEKSKTVPIDARKFFA